MRGTTFLGSRGGSDCPVCDNQRRLWFRGVRVPTDWQERACPCTLPDDEQLPIITQAALRLLWTSIRSAPPPPEENAL